jgi:hypothetical protein
MALFGKKTCPNCGQPQEKNWDKCPFCAQMGMAGGGGGMGGGMGAAMGGGMAPSGMTGFGGPPPPMGGFGGPPPPATQFGGGGFGAPPPAPGYGGPPPPMGGGYVPPPVNTYGSAPGGGNKTQMFMTAGGQSVLLGWLVPLKGPHRGELLSLKGQSVIGKDPTCDICLNDGFLSSRHATIRQQGGAFILEDHSTNGTYVNDKKVSRQELIDNDIVKLGQTLVKFKCL